MFFFCKASRDSNKDHRERDVGGLHCHRRECGCGGCDRTWAVKKALPGRPPLAKVLVWSLSIFKLSLSNDCESPDTLLLLYQLKKCEDVSTHGGHGRGEAGNMRTYAAHDVSARFGTVSIPRKASRTGGFLELNQMHMAQTRRLSLSREPQMAHPICVIAVRAT